MKFFRLKNIMMVLLLVGVATACIEEPELSRKTFLPELVVTGDNPVVLRVGEAYNEAGAVATEGGVEIEVSISGEVNVDEPGVYFVSYSALNGDGFPASAKRDVVVVPVGDEDASPADPTGSYVYASDLGGSSIISKLGPSVYYTTNTYSSGLTVGGYLYSTDGVNFTILPFTSPFGPWFGTGTYDDALGEFTYIVNIPAFGIADRPRFWVRG